MKKKRLLFLMLILFLFIINCGSGNSMQLERETSGTFPWVYQLQNSKIENLSQSGFSLAVIDYSRDGTDAKKFSKDELQQLVAEYITPVAYISIGEAESYRFYWEKSWVEKEDNNQLTSSAPAWLGHTNPDWKGNYKVRYWDADWRDRFIKPYLDRIIQQGFHGVYLDIIDGFEYWGDPEIYSEGLETSMDNDPVGDEEDAARRMIELVQWISRYCRKHSPLGKDFFIFPQNGERILLYDENGSYLEAISGMGVESIWYDSEERLPTSTVNERLGFLEKITKADKIVLSVDYVDTGDRKAPENAKRIKNYVSKCRSKGFSCYVANTDAELKTVNRIQGIQP